MLGFDFIPVITFLRWLESIILELGDEMQRVCMWIRSSGNIGLHLLWRIMHLILSIWYFVVGLLNVLESFVITSGWLKRYKTLDTSQVKYLAVVVDSEEARQTLKILELLRWLEAIGFKNVCLYDNEGVLKKSKDALMLWLKSEKMSKEATSEPLLEQKYMNLEVLSFSDGRRAVAKVANILLERHYLSAEMEKPNLTESDMTNALGEIGYGGSDPDLMLVYGPARCHLGFPAWRIRYTEIVHMGPLKSMKFGALVKAIHRFTMVHQNYGK
ncbi:putative undecaprenyl diphosphate synthase [Handroanthus impetiginosus]|uniref:ditrans,polycis-polyprenyl diphosphate synthase [(2E,6E)-farnesyldiphosphate specific] n=1 Tax=Handroanthus impetiginosus TaxID=429701 RepID=A0A2G9HX66_9LAMI|nr:putative undecaprenyl diphosphate synthase [Handroanthus impetiginosus]